MTKYFTNNLPIINLYKKPSVNSEIVTQMIYGDSFLVSEKTKNWTKIKIIDDGYKGYIKRRRFCNFLKSSHKVSVLKANIYKLPNKQKKISQLTFNSKIKVLGIKNDFFKFEKGWINKRDVMPILFKEKNSFKKISIFKNVKYKWGGKSFKGIDCSALIQLFLNFNNKFCPRDARDQVKYFKRNIKLKNIRKNDIIYWKGHVALALSKKKLIHAYGPMKKTVIMNIKQTIKRIDQTANLKVISIKRI
tara:strand:- start:292 stop:1032 length:741 start_codon:yes stop_codon:yes gene_type:complete